MLTKNPFVEAYSLVQRGASGQLTLVPYHQAYTAELNKARDLLLQAAELAEDDGFKAYLKLRTAALTSDDFQPSDFAWMDMKTNPIELVIGPIEVYEDQLFGHRTAYESYLLIKDLEWNQRLAKFYAFLLELQKGLPVDVTFQQGLERLSL